MVELRVELRVFLFQDMRMGCLKTSE